MKLKVLTLLMILGIMPSVLADGNHTDFSNIQGLLDNPVDCSTLTEEQLEQLGEYFMELRHPGKVHEVMDNMMGGEGSESLRLAHIRMGEAFYCRTSEGTGFGMMGSNMMGYNTNSVYSNTYGSGIYILLGIIIILLGRKK